MAGLYSPFAAQGHFPSFLPYSQTAQPDNDGSIDSPLCLSVDSNHGGRCKSCSYIRAGGFCGFVLFLQETVSRRDCASKTRQIWSVLVSQLSTFALTANTRAPSQFHDSFLLRWVLQPFFVETEEEVTLYADEQNNVWMYVLFLFLSIP